MQPYNINPPGQYPLPELTTLTLTKSPDKLSVTEHLVVAQLLEEFKRIKRNA